MRSQELRIVELEPFGESMMIHRERIVDLWVDCPAVSDIFSMYDIDRAWFVQNFGDNILGHFINIVKGTRDPGDCPYMNKMIRYLKERDVSVTDVVNICVNLRKSVIDFIMDYSDDQLDEIRSSCRDGELIREINQLFDMNLSGVLKTFTETLSIKERRIRQYMKIIDQNVIISKTDLKGVIIDVSDAFCSASGYSRTELIGQNHNIVRHPDMAPEFFANLWKTIQQGDIWTGMIKNQRKDGTSFYVEGTIRPLQDHEGNLYGYMAVRNDVTHTIQMYTDPLTGISNRLKFEEILNDGMTRFIEKGMKFVVILFDVDDFKKVNDTYGHRMGDRVLKRVSQIASNTIRNSDILARWGGEEFVILADGDLSLIAPMAERIRSAIARENLLVDRTLTCSFGATEIRIGDTEDSIFQRADDYLYYAKKMGKNKVITDNSNEYA